MNFLDLSQINQWSQEPAYFIAKGDRAYDDGIFRAAGQALHHCGEKPILLLSGPSGSGKTTSALRIEQLLKEWGHNTHTVSMDNYFYRREDGWVPRDEEGQVDYESPYMLDIELFRRDLQRIANCEPVQVPTFDFVNQRRGDKSTLLQRRPGEVVVVEGIHALNPEVSGDVHAFATGVYVSVRTRIRCGETVLHPKYIRLLRRMLRDRVGRGMSIQATLDRLDSVERGEQKFIMPHKGNAEIHLDTICQYELGLYKQLLPELKQLPEESRNRPGMREMIGMLEQVAPLDPNRVPKDSLVREFIGGGLAGEQ